MTEKLLEQIIYLSPKLFYLIAKPILEEPYAGKPVIRVNGIAVR